MKQFCVLLFCCLSFLSFSQELETTKDSIINDTLNPYIEDHKKQLNIKFDISNDQINYNIPYDNETVSIKTNLKVSYGFIFSYKYFSVRLGIRPKLSENEEKNKGKTDVFRIGIKMLFNKWSHNLEYNYFRGYYVDNTNEVSSLDTPEDFFIQFPNLTTNTFSGTSKYKFNDNYSVRAVESNTEIQLKSAGTLMPGIAYSYYDIKGTDKIKTEEDVTITRDDFNDFKGFTFILETGYYYTFVLHKYWYVNIFATPGLGFDFVTTTFNSPNSSYDENFNNTYFSFKSGAALGYNGKKIYFGCEFKYNYLSGNNNDKDSEALPIRSNFHAFIGYRFKAPKQVSKPLDFIEEKVPVLKTDQ